MMNNEKLAKLLKIAEAQRRRHMAQMQETYGESSAICKELRTEVLEIQQHIAMLQNTPTPLEDHIEKGKKSTAS